MNQGNNSMNGTGPAKKQKKEQPMLLRSLAILVVFILGGGFLGLRLSQLQIDEASEWEARAARQQVANIPIEPQRGNIYDRNMKLLAQSGTVWTIEASPEALNKSVINDEVSTEEDPARVASRELAALLGLDEEELYAKLSEKDKMYYKVKAKVEKPIADQVRELCKLFNIKGIYLTEDTKRYYPYESLASTVLGFVGNDNDGLEGLERWYDETLAGVPGRTTMVRDAWGREITTGMESTLYPAEDGHSIVLTLDAEIQRIMEKNLETAVTKNNARQRGFAIAMDVKTGAILALAVYPSYNPNKPYDIIDPATLELLNLLPEGSEQSVQLQGEARTLQWRNKALADTYEPGSVLKIVTAAAALDSGAYVQESPFVCNGQIQVGDKIMSCAGDPPTRHGAIDLRNALIESCNVSFIQMSAGMGAQTWYNYLRAFGLTEPTGVDLPGEPSQRAISNLIYSEDRLGPVELASCSFGQSNKYTAVQMITAASAAINGGNLMQPYIVDRELDANGNVVKQYSPTVKRQVVSPETSAQIADILEDLVTNTTNGQNAYAAGYRIGGKSGTSEKLEVMVQEEREDAFISSFFGFAPADDPQIAVLLALDEPEDTKMGNYFGGRLAGPFVREIIRESLDVMGIQPVFETDEELARTTRPAPKCTDNELVRAQTLLNKEGLTYHVVGNGTTVIGQTPAPGSPVPYAGQVVLYTDPALPQETATVPDVHGRSPGAAVEVLKGLGLNVLTTGAPDSGKGVVVSAQTAEPGTVLPKGTVVTLTLEDQTRVAD